MCRILFPQTKTESNHLVKRIVITGRIFTLPVTTTGTLTLWDVYESRQLGSIDIRGFHKIKTISFLLQPSELLVAADHLLYSVCMDTGVTRQVVEIPSPRRCSPSFVLLRTQRLLGSVGGCELLLWSVIVWGEVSGFSLPFKTFTSDALCLGLYASVCLLFNLVILTFKTTFVKHNILYKIMTKFFF